MHLKINSKSFSFCSGWTRKFRANIKWNSLRFQLLIQLLELHHKFFITILLPPDFNFRRVLNKFAIKLFQFFKRKVSLTLIYEHSWLRNSKWNSSILLFASSSLPSSIMHEPNIVFICSASHINNFLRDK